MYKVLLVDDEPFAIEGLKLIVDWKNLDYEIAGECKNGEEAVCMIEKVLPDLVITDIRMPVMDGLDLIAHVKKHIAKDIKFIILSSYSEFEYAQKALRLGINHYVLKPVFQEEITEVLIGLSKQLGLQKQPENKMKISQGKTGLYENDILSRAEQDGLKLEYQPVWQKNFGSREITYLNDIVDALEDLNPQKLEIVIESAFGYFQNQLLAPEIVKMFVMNIIYHCIRMTQEMGGSSDGLLDRYEISQLEQRKTTVGDLKGLLLNFCQESYFNWKALQERNLNQNIYRIQEYIQQNYKQNLTLKEIAKNFYLHPVYLGQLFLKNFGFSFSEYLHQLRIREAERLMTAGNMKPHEIAAEVGYNNYHSFLNNFRKYTGHNPADYKEKLEAESGE
jgi:Response regulator containing CheY-like receiver domain and AraC-type DNA-binding domain